MFSLCVMLFIFGDYAVTSPRMDEELRNRNKEMNAVVGNYWRGTAKLRTLTFPPTPWEPPPGPSK